MSSFSDRIRNAGSPSADTSINWTSLTMPVCDLISSPAETVGGRTDPARTPINIAFNIAITIVVLSGTASLDALDLLIQDFLLFQIQTGQLQTSFRGQ